MPFVTMASVKNKLDGSVRKLAYDFLQKLQTDDTTTGLHIEPMEQARDRRARTGRVNQQWRAVLFKMDGVQDGHYVYMGTFPHDEAIRIARTTTLRINPALGVPEFEQHPEMPAPEKLVGEQTVAEVAHREDAHGTEAVVDDWVNPLPESWTVESLVAEAGLSEQLAERALVATSMAELNALIDEAPEAQGLVLLDLAHGKELQAILDELGLGPVSPEKATLGEDEQLIAAFENSTGGFVFVGDNPQELMDALESMSIDRWRVFLHPDQRKYVEQQTSGPFRLSGGAGTGKTVVLLHRARQLARENPNARIVLTTFTRALADALTRQLRLLDPDVPLVGLGEAGVTVLGIDQVAAKVVHQASPAERTEAVRAVLGPGTNALSERPRGGEETRAFQQAVSLVDPDESEELTHPAFLEQEYLSVVLAHRVVDEHGYLRASRRGRGTALNRNARKELWPVFAQYRRAHQLEDKVSYAEVAAIAGVILEQRAASGGRLVADHVLVDEGQDLHAGHWTLLRGLVAPGPDDLFIAEDSHQRIYGQKTPLSRHGINIVGRARRLRLNYRTTAENLAYAVGMLSGQNYTDLEGEAEDTSEYRSARSGPKPILVRADSLEEEITAAAGHLNWWIDADQVDPEAIGVMVRSEQAEKAVTRGLRDAGALERSADGRGRKRSVSVMTMHKAKGMEFERVVVLGAGASEVPAGWKMEGLPEAERRDVRMQERSLLYVAATRARDELVVTWTGEASEFLGD